MRLKNLLQNPLSPLKNAVIISMHRINLILVNFLVFTFVTSTTAFHIMVKAQNTFDGVDVLAFDGYVK